MLLERVGVTAVCSIQLQCTNPHAEAALRGMPMCCAYAHLDVFVLFVCFSQPSEWGAFIVHIWVQEVRVLSPENTGLLLNVIYPFHDKLQIESVREITASPPRQTPDSNQGQGRERREKEGMREREREREDTNRQERAPTSTQSPMQTEITSRQFCCQLKIWSL